LQKTPKWNFDNSFANLPNKFFTKQHPVPVKSPKLLIFNNKLADYLGVPLEPDVFAGNAVPKTAEPLAQAYAGHQFGHFTMLGDGRAILLGEQITQDNKRFDIQLKGSGKTPYSRGGDGRAALGPMLREYIISEAMHALKIPTTRSLAVVETGETVWREKKLTGAILTRVASSHIRVGTFEYAARFGTLNDVKTLANYAISRHFPEVEEAENKYLVMLKEVVKRQAYLISKWQLAGFIHGVMNTDNMSISGETIDYGPCAFMDTYNPATVFSSIDKNGRYAYENQPKMAVWNLSRFAETLLPLLHDNAETAIALAQEEISNFFNLYQSNWLAGMRAKLGLFNEHDDDEELINDLFQLMQDSKADYTNTFKDLTLGKSSFNEWHKLWQERLSKEQKSKDEIRELMKINNPSIIPRNHFVEEALKAAENDDLSVFNNLVNALSNPYEYSPEHEEYSKLPKNTPCCYKTFCGT